MTKVVKFGATGRDLHIDVPLSNVAINYRPEGMVADMIAPVVNVNKQSDRITVYSRADALRIEKTNRAPGTPANKITRSISSLTYFADNYALKYPITAEDKANMDAAYVAQMYNGRVNYLQDKLFLDWENRVASQVTSSSNIGSSSAVSSAWSDLDNSDPESDINTAIDNVYDTTGKRPNKITLGESAYRNLRRNVSIRNTINGTNNGGGYATRQQLAALFEVDEILVSAAFENTGNEAQAESLAQIWGDHVLVSYTAPRPSIETPSFMYSFRWSVAGIPNMQVERHPYDSELKSESVEVGYYQDEKITGSDYAFLLIAVNSST